MQFSAIYTIKYHAIRHDLSSTAYDTLEAAVKAKPYLIVMEAKGRWYNFNYTNQVCEIKIFSGYGYEVSEINEGHWCLKSVGTTLDYYFQGDRVSGIIIDPLGVKKHLDFGKYYGGVRTALVKLREMAQYESLSNYQKVKDNELLKNKIEQLKAQNEQIKNHLNSPKTATDVPQS